MKKCWCQLKWSGVSRDSYIFWIFLTYGITVSSLIVVGFMWQFLRRGAFLAPRPPSVSSPEKAYILNSVKIRAKLCWSQWYNWLLLSKCYLKLNYSIILEQFFKICMINCQFDTRHVRNGFLESLALTCKS